MALAEAYEALYRAWPYGDMALFGVGMWVTFVGCYWGYNAFLGLCARFGWCERYRILPPAQAADPDLIARTLKEQFVSTFVAYPLAVPVVYHLFVHRYDFTAESLPAWPVWLAYIALYFAVKDTYGYWSHRAMHAWPALYAFHKQHHEFRVTVGVASSHSHPLELVNVFIETLGPLWLVPSHVCILWAYFGLRCYETVDAHCGYAFPWSLWAVWDEARFHNFHHSHNVGNFGHSPLWDWITGTDKSYRAFRKQQLRVQKETSPQASQ